MLFVENQT